LIPEDFPPQQKKTDAVKNSLLSLAENKTQQEKIAGDIEKTTDNPILRQLANALSKSNRLMAEDLIREAGYMLPQSENVQHLLKSLLDEPQTEDFPKEVVNKLLEKL
jgi:hypothetical protein